MRCLLLEQVQSGESPPHCLAVLTHIPTCLIMLICIKDRYRYRRVDQIPSCPLRDIRLQTDRREVTHNGLLRELHTGCGLLMPRAQ